MNVEALVAISVPTVLGLLAVLLWTRELRLRRGLFEQDLGFRQRQFDDEQRLREEQREWLTEHMVRIRSFSDLVAASVSEDLKADPVWAFEALERAHLAPHGQTLFADRLGHFRAEKEAIASEFVPMLLDRARWHIESGKSVCFLIDSGTTLYPFFAKIGEAVVQEHENDESWVTSLSLATNNLAGIDALMETGLLDPRSRYSRLAVRCHLLPGEPLPIYAAVTGPKTEKALAELVDEQKESAVFIGLVTGNWIRLNRGENPCPVPLARGEGHIGFKQLLLEKSDEVYVVTPLGKVFAEATLDQVNSALGYSDKNADPDRKPYAQLDVSGKSGAVKIVSTTRVRQRLLHELGTKVSTLLGPGQQDHLTFAQDPFAQVSHIFFSFDRLPDNWYEEMLEEFPHENTRSDEFMRDRFFVELPYDTEQSVVGRKKETSVT